MIFEDSHLNVLDIRQVSDDEVRFIAIDNKGERITICLNKGKVSELTRGLNRMLHHGDDTPHYR